MFPLRSNDASSKTLGDETLPVMESKRGLVIYLPKYSSEEIMKNKLLEAATLQNIEKSYKMYPSSNNA